MEDKPINRPPRVYAMRRKAQFLKLYREEGKKIAEFEAGQKWHNRLQPGDIMVLYNTDARTVVEAVVSNSYTLTEDAVLNQEAHDDTIEQLATDLGANSADQLRQKLTVHVRVQAVNTVIYFDPKSIKVHDYSKKAVNLPIHCTQAITQDQLARSNMAFRS